MTVHQAVHRVTAFSKAAHVHQMLGVIIVVAHASEIARVVSEINVWHLVIAFALFGLYMVTQKGEAKTELA